MDVAELFPSLACIATILLAIVCTAKMKSKQCKTCDKYINVFRKQHENPNKHANDKELQNILRSISFTILLVAIVPNTPKVYIRKIKATKIWCNENGGASRRNVR